MAVMEWSIVLPFCEPSSEHLLSDTRLHRLLVRMLDIGTQAKPPLHAYLQDNPRVTTLPPLQAAGTEDPTMVWHPSHLDNPRYTLEDPILF